MNAIEFLKADHRKVEELFMQIEKEKEGPNAQQLFKQIYHELSIHAVIEEQVFYPLLAKFPDLSSVLKDSYKEHAEAKQKMGEILALNSISGEWQTMVKKLQKDIEHHVKDEEEKMFPKVQEKLGNANLEKIGKQLEQARSSKLDSQILSQPNMELFNMQH
jgi:hemerythrin superfamily protein